MATERALNCSPCDYKHETTPAVKWCVDCAEALCATCLDVHKGLKVTRNHNVFGIEDHSTLQGIMLDLSETQRCEQHDNTSEYFCPVHDQIVCIKCIQTKHIRCTGWLPISETADGVKSSVAKETIKQDLDDVIRNVEKLIDSYEKERISNQTVYKKLKDEAAEVVQSIIKKVGKLEEEFFTKFDLQQRELSSNIDNRKTELLGKLHKLKQLKDKLNGIEGYASDTQLFLSIRRMSKQLSDFIIEVKSLTEDPLILLKELKLAKPVRSFLSDVTLFGHVHSDRKLISFQSTKLQKIQSHISVSFSQTIEIQDVIKFNVSKLESKSMKLWSAVILPNKQLIFKWDKSKNFVIHTLDGKFVKHQYALDNVENMYIAIVDAERLALSYGKTKEVSIFNIQTKKPERKILFNDNCYGLSYDGRSLYAAANTAIFCIDLKADFVRIDSVPVNGDSVFHLAVNKDKLYYANNNKDTVYCCSKNGEEIWSFTNEKMKFPNGITTDRFGNTYVKCTNSHNVLVISSDGKHFKEILNVSDGLLFPRVIFYDKSQKLLLVCNAENGQAFLCKMK